MPLTRYQLRNEYGLASPDLYRTADKDDSETLLEAVAMAGLVGVLRQLGDLAEFAAEIFHDLHEEVMATAARGHALVVRAHQLEADVPAIEKAFLSQNSHPSFFTNAGINWHPILHTDQNLITRGDLPRCVMDSYEECWGPPRLFLLDKFDVAGAGACLKRYTDPSFFKNETASSDLKSLDVQMENNVRKAKKKGPRLKNGESPQNISTSHAKLHQLFMEERLGNNFNDPDRLVKLKKRQLNGSPLDFKSGKSYMEKFLQTPSPEHKAVYETSVDPPLLKLTSDDSSESGMETVDIGVVSPVKRSSEIIESICPSPNSPEVALMPNMQELNSEISTLETAKAPVLSPAVDTGRIRPILARVIAKNGLLVDGEQNHKSNLYVDTPVHITGEVENYLDALAAMETDSESENEHSIKSDLGVFGGGKCGTDSDANNGQLDIEGLSSDSQLLAVSTVFDYGNSTSMRYMLSGFSCSDKISNTADNVPPNTEKTAEAFTSTTNFASKDETYSIQLPTHTDIQGSSSAGLVHANDAIVNETLGASPGEYELEEALSDSDRPDSELFSTDGIGFSRSISFEVAPMDHSQTDIVCTDSPLVDELHGGDEAISSDAMMHLSKNLEPDPEHKSRCNYLDQLHQTDSIEENAEENSAPLAMISLESTIMPLKQQSDSVQSDTGVHSDNGLLPDMFEVLRPGNSAPAVDVLSNVMVNSDCAMPLMESLHCRCTNERLSKTVHDVPSVGQNLDEISESNLEKVSEPAAGKQIRELSHMAYGNGSAAVKLDKKANSFDVSDLKGHIGKADPPTKAVFSAHVAASTACDTTFHDDYDNIGYVPSSLIVPPCRPPMISEEHHSASKIPYEQAQKFTKRIYPESSILSQAKRDQGKAVDSDSMVSKPGSCNYSHKEDVAKKSILTKPMDTPILGEFTFSPLSLVVDLDLESKLLCSTHLPGTKHDVPAPPNLNSETHSEHLLELPSNQIQGESPLGDDACSDSSSLLSGRAQPHMDQELCFALHELSPGDLPGQHPIPSVDVSAQSVDQEIDQVKHRLSSRPSDFGLVHDATHLRIVEMPPLPPLPPMQWRMGKAQLDFHSQTELVGHTEESFPLTSEYRADRKSQLDFSAPEIQRGGSRNKYPPLEAVEKMQHYVSDKSADSLVQPTGFVADISGMANATSILCPGTTFENLQSSPSSVIEAVSNKRQEYGSPEKDNDREGSRKPFAGMPHLEQTVSGHDLMSSLDNQAEPSDAYMVDTDREGNICQAILPECGLQAENSIGMSVTRTANGQEQPSNNKEKQPPDDIKGQPPVNAEVQHPIEAVEHPLQDLTTLGGEMRLASIPSILHCLPISEAVPLSRLKAPSLSAIRKANVNPAIENPRPGDSLIDAVAALDKSRLRKVSKLGRPQVGPRLDERDSLLEQIRTKSFNLRPAGGTRPSIQRIQGPKTNLRIAAILEKANSIRQATVGSDEEGDDDNWSDS